MGCRVLTHGAIGSVGFQVAVVVHSSRRIGELCTWTKIDQVHMRVKPSGPPTGPTSRDPCSFRTIDVVVIFSIYAP